MNKWAVEMDHEQGFEPVPAMETRTLLFFPEIPGDMQLRDKWYMVKRKRFPVPSPHCTILPHRQKIAEARAKVLSVYLRPWTLDAEEATEQVPLLTDLN